MADGGERIEHLRGVLATLEDQEHALPVGDRAAVAAAVATARAVRDSDEAPSPEAAALAEEWLVLHLRLSALESRLEADDRGPEEPAARLEEARAGA
ncbi:MAG: hypothetical protein GWN79_03780, partial [Actinobacteria bacterium]|nr:hypothetical protein [Actinomycetota bacterium]NIS35800.1 hypothetical protein [Actinomycetota bacterium]NIT94647.1 hypothetical protein [Actinomycetota bacterium]NIU18257.1 hypothetical protein [Actinomycetota bacterium]NIU70430.1 hypothetical protein [Actinomycetota bacterium]